MKFIVTVLVITCVFANAFAQDGYGSTSIYDRVGVVPKDEHVFVLPPNGNWDQQRWKDSVYRFDSFQPGKFEMITGFTPSHRPMLNYNVLLETMDLLQPSGEIMVMRKSPDVRAVWVGDHKFIYDQSFGYLEIILDGKISVAQKTSMDAVYELSNGHRYPLRTIDLKGSPMKATIYFWQHRQYFIFGESLKPFRSGSAVLPNLLPEQKSKIKAFSKSNRIDYKKKEDILKIVAYANEQAAAQN